MTLLMYLSSAALEGLANNKNPKDLLVALESQGWGLVGMKKNVCSWVCISILDFCVPLKQFCCIGGRMGINCDT
jgi:hypothetical protein